MLGGALKTCDHIRYGHARMEVAVEQGTCMGRWNIVNPREHAYEFMEPSMSEVGRVGESDAGRKGLYVHVHRETTSRCPIVVVSWAMAPKGSVPNYEAVGDVVIIIHPMVLESR